MTSPDCFSLRTDGGARGNPGPAGAGFVLHGPDGHVVCEGGRFLGVATNNIAEWEAVVWGLECAREIGAPSIVIYADSELVIKQLRGEYRVKNEGLKPLFERARALLTGFREARFVHVPRAENAHADRLANEAMDIRGVVGDAPIPGGGLGQASLFDC